MTYKTPWSGDKTDEFAVTIQEPSDVKDNYVQIMASDSYKDVLRVDEQYQEGEKTVSFDVYYMNNGVKVQNFGFDKYPAAGASAATQDAYYFKILKDGQDFTGQVDYTAGGNKVTVHPSKINPLRVV